MYELPGMEDIALLSKLESQFYRLAGRDFDFELSQDAVSYLKGLYSAEELASLDSLLDHFVQSNESRLRSVYDAYAATPERVLFLFQPESLLILERLDKDLHRLEESWVERFPRKELEAIASAWGTPLD